MDWKRPKDIKSVTINIKTQCGTLNITKGYDGDNLIEVFAIIGKNGVCPNILLSSFCKCLSIVLQSGLAKYKCVKKIKKQFQDVSCGMEFQYEKKRYMSCLDFIAQNVVEELEK